MQRHTAENLNRTFSDRPHIFLQPSPALHSAFLHLAKQFLDPLASDVSEAQRQRQRAMRQSKKRKRRDSDLGKDKAVSLRMERVHVDGLEVDQVWQQATRILGAATEEIERELPEDEGNEESQSYQSRVQRHVKTQSSKSARFDEDGFEVNNSDDRSENEEMVTNDGDEDGNLDRLNKDQEKEDEISADDGSLDIGEETPMSELSHDDEGAQEVFIKDRHGLNDGFFSIDHFNRQSQLLEQQDARGDPDDGAASDEEEIDWAMDPTAIDPRASIHRGSAGELDDLEDGEDEEDQEEDGPAFGNMDLNAPEGDSDIDNDAEADDDVVGMGDFGNTNDVLYADFFAPPARNPSKKSKPRKRHVTGSAPVLATTYVQEKDHEIERTISAVHRDLFDDELSEAEDQTPPDLPQGQSKLSNLSTHERTQLALRAEIRRLEAANVAAKPWSLTGEIVAPARPLNSLLEEDLDFERAGKPVPVITEEVSESIEDLIKRRILARAFDEVIRRRPNDLVTGVDARRGRVREELADTKPTRGLAEEYEQEHLRRTDPGFVDTRTEALKQAHKQIETQWASVSAQLDALSNWHYKPRAPAPSLEIRVDAPTISMEDARPSAGGEVGGASMLAPQEVYRPGEEEKREGEVVTRGGTAIAKEEETREQRKRRRAREKERGKKAAARKEGAATAPKGKRAGNNEVMGQLKKGGAKIIDRKGNLRDVEGNAVREAGDRTGAGSFKL